jgi:hypothetical protein
LKNACGLGHQGFGIMTRLDQQVAFVDRDAAHACKRHDLFTGALPVDFGHTEAWIIGHVLGELCGRSGFKPQVELNGHPFADVVHDFDRFQAAQVRTRRFHDPGQPFGQTHVAGNDLGDAGTQNLDRNIASIAGDGKVDLGD